MSKTPGNPTPAVKIAEYHPELPDALTLEDEKFVVCPHEDPKSFVCMDHNNARIVSRNKIKTLKWAKDARAVIDYYAGSDRRVQSK